MQIWAKVIKNSVNLIRFGQNQNFVPPITLGSSAMFDAAKCYAVF